MTTQARDRFVAGRLNTHLGLRRVAASGREGGRPESRSPERGPQGGRAEAHSRGHVDDDASWLCCVGLKEWRIEEDGGAGKGCCERKQDLGKRKPRLPSGSWRGNFEPTRPGPSRFPGRPQHMCRIPAQCYAVLLVFTTNPSKNQNARDSLA